VGGEALSRQNAKQKSKTTMEASLFFSRLGDKVEYFVNLVEIVPEPSHEAQRSKLAQALVEDGAGALTEDDWRRELLRPRASGPGLVSVENVIHALISTPECYVDEKVGGPARFRCT